LAHRPGGSGRTTSRTSRAVRRVDAARIDAIRVAMGALGEVPSPVVALTAVPDAGHARSRRDRSSRGAHRLTVVLFFHPAATHMPKIGSVGFCRGAADPSSSELDEAGNAERPPPPGTASARAARSGRRTTSARGPPARGVTCPTDPLGVSISRWGYLSAVAVETTFRSDDRDKVVLPPPGTQLAERIDMTSLRGQRGHADEHPSQAKSSEELNLRFGA